MSTKESRTARLDWIKSRPGDKDAPASTPAAIAQAHGLVVEMSRRNAEPRYGIFPAEDGGVEFISVGPIATASAWVSPEGRILATRTPREGEGTFHDGADIPLAASLLSDT